jgi:DNA-directed RNA polymerase specialized sigma24 family protein
VPKKNKITFESCIEIIDTEIAKRRGKWSLTSLSWIDFDDVSQIIRIHIYEKWDQYDPEKPIRPWLNRVISNQLKNIIRNNYTNYTRPCLRCAAAEEPDGCRIYETQCNDCPLYAHWEKRKLSAYNLKMPLSLENHQQEVNSVFDDYIDFDEKIKQLNKKMEEVLKPTELLVYQSLFVRKENELTVAKKLGFKTTEKKRSPGYKQIQNIKKQIIKKVKSLIEKGDIEFL